MISGGNYLEVSKITSPTCDIIDTKIVMIVAAANGTPLYTLDVSRAFLHNDELDEADVSYTIGPKQIGPRAHQAAPRAP